MHHSQPLPMDIFERIFEFTPDALLVVGSDGRIRRANHQAEVLFGHARRDMVGMTVEQMIPERFSSGHHHHRDGYLSGPRVRPMGVGLELFAKRSDGSEFPVDIMLSPMDTEEGRVVLTVVRDVTERRRVEQRVQDSLREKEVLLREIHHRVKNNLAVISSLFYLQSTRTTDADTIAILTESQDRVRSMALVHETLYRSGNLSSVDFADYAVSLCEELERGHRLPDQKIEFRTEIEPVHMSIDIAIPCGLILNELVTNSLKHAFPPGRDGRIDLRIHRNADGRGQLIVADNGIGIGAHAHEATQSSLGLRLIESLTRQIDGSFAMRDAGPGTMSMLEMPLETLSA